MTRHANVALAVVVALLAFGWVEAARELLAQCKDDTTGAMNYGETPTADHKTTCDKAPNTDCWGAHEGCSLWNEALDRCNDPHQQARCNSRNYVYTGNYKTNHVIMIPTTPTRGIEDIEGNDFKAATNTAPLWGYFWADSMAGTTGGDGKQGLSDATGALTMNTPWFREYHQMHLHAGVRDTAFDSCVSKMTYATHWQSMPCTGLSGGTKATQANLYYKTITGLSDVWGAYKDGIGNANLIQTTIPQQFRKYHVGIIITRNAKVLRPDQFFVILYAPVKPEDKLGRGHFLTGI